MGQKRLAGDFAPVTVISENRKDDRKRNMIKHVLFDLDGTLLPMDQNQFVKYYMPLLAKRFVKYGMEPKALIGTIWKGVEAMVLNDGSMTNEDAFWKCFEKISGLSRADFEVITTYETYHYCKPNPKYFQEVMEKFGLNPKECLMVGNDVQEDLTIRSLGVKTYLLTDTLENKKNIPLEEVETEYKGTMEELYEWFQSYFVHN